MTHNKWLLSINKNNNYIFSLLVTLIIKFQIYIQKYKKNFTDKKKWFITQKLTEFDSEQAIIIVKINKREKL